LDLLSNFGSAVQVENLDRAGLLTARELTDRSPLLLHLKSEASD
jgi:hypothetical protein